MLILYIFYLFISKICRNFAHVIELERHIEILLLSHDCVIVPNLGGFMTHHIDAHYDEEEQLFLPPLRTLGFNPQLKINDSLLVQSYIEAYDISYPEALQRIDDEVNELRQHLENEGSYELNDIGVISLNDDGNYVFTPCEAGILTPSLYGLSSFEIERFKAVRQQSQPLLPVASENEEPQSKAAIIPLNDTPETTEENEDDDDVVRIKFSWIRNTVAIAAILLAIFFLALPTGKTELMTRTISNINNGLLFGMMSEDTNMSKIEIKKADIAPTTAKADSLISVKEAAQGDTIPQTTTPESKTIEKQRNGYCIVLAGYISKKNAQAFVEELQKKGYTESEIFIRNNVTRVIYGNYASEQDAYNDLRRIHRNKDLAEAWVMHL